MKYTPSSPLSKLTALCFVGILTIILYFVAQFTEGASLRKIIILVFVASGGLVTSFVLALVTLLRYLLRKANR